MDAPGDSSAARSFRLDPSEGPAAGMRRIAQGRAERAIERLREAESAADPSACIHAARKDLKKLRAVVRLLRHELGDDLYRAENERYRDAGRLLAAPRDAEVKLETLEALRAECGEELGPGAGEWMEALKADRDAAVEAVRRGPATPIAQALGAVEQGSGRVAAWPLEADSWRLVAPGLDRAYRRGRKAMRRAGREPSAENLHRWRKRVKDLWYQLRILEGLLPGSLSGGVATADRLAEALGEHHDLTVLRDDLLVRELPAVDRVAAVAAMERRQDALAATAFDLGGRLYAKKPKAFRKRVRRGWKEWRDA